MRLIESVAAYSAAPRELVRQHLTEDVKASLAEFVRSPQTPVAFAPDTLRELIAMDVLALDAAGRPRPNTAIFLAADFARLHGPIQELAIGTAEAVRANAGSLNDAPPAVRNFIGGIMGMNQGLHAILRALGLTQDWPSKTGRYERTKVDLNEACPEHDRFGPDLQVKRVYRGQRYTSVVIGDGGGDYHSHLLAARRAAAAATDASRAYFTALADHLTDALPRLLLGEIEDGALARVAHAALIDPRDRSAVITTADAEQHQPAVASISDACAAYYCAEADRIRGLLSGTMVAQQGAPLPNLMLNFWRLLRRTAAAKLYENGFLTDRVPADGSLTVFYDNAIPYFS